LPKLHRISISNPARALDARGIAGLVHSGRQLLIRGQPSRKKPQVLTFFPVNDEG
jgi:hypothetical protein